MSELPETTCPACAMKFTVIFQVQVPGDRCEYCPFCGEEFDYQEHTDAE